MNEGRVREQAPTLPPVQNLLHGSQDVRENVIPGLKLHDLLQRRSQGPFWSSGAKGVQKRFRVVAVEV